MGDPMDMSLDDLISTKSNHNRGYRGGRGGRNGRFSNNHSRKSPGGMRSDTMDLDFQVTDDLRSSNRGRNSNKRRAEPYGRPPRGNVEGLWSHDLYDSPRRGGSPGANVRAPSGGLVTVRIENLHWNLKDVKFSYDQAGRSEGVAEVEYNSSNGAQAAVDNFNNRELDGQRMQLTILERTRPSSRSVKVKPLSITSRLGPPSILTRLGRPITDRLGEKVSERGDRGTRGGGGGRGGGSGGRQQKKPVTQGDLDAEMEAYMSGETGGEPVQQDASVLLVGRREVLSYDGVEAPGNVDM
ncbi:hypothetical protein HK097_004743 [Rhizophlyctis rosea]|uniref:Chromatin target of PRMT1 protein C-terminal domain-containing protein n=1 Tax=Rhizophlyctis rosea TaxID=64517 RepID=A0AAD5SH92_9FUNG|nr:hypothetical protein HK097_004743 [Rhizophlyctis rosea]